MHGWKQIKYKELGQGYQENGDNEEDEKDSGDGSDDQGKQASGF